MFPCPRWFRLVSGSLILLLATGLRAAPDPAQLYQKGGAYLKGKGVAKDATQAARHFLAAAKLGHAPSQFMLGRLYAKGVGVEKSRPKAVHWLEKARDQGNEKATALLAKLSAAAGKTPKPSPKPSVGAGDAGADAPPSEQERTSAESIRTSQKNMLPHLTKETLKTYQDLAAQDSPYYVFFMGYMHEEPNSFVKQDLAEARRLYQKALKLNYSLARVFLYDLDHAGK